MKEIEKIVAICSPRRLGERTKQLNEFIRNGMDCKAIIYSTSHGHFYSPKAHKQSLTKAYKAGAKAETAKFMAEIMEMSKSYNSPLNPMTIDRPISITGDIGYKVTQAILSLLYRLHDVDSELVREELNKLNHD